ncbi:hypothetical protein BAE40_13510 [Mesorhizobium loti]|nr:hypothetical protein BAE40_13510 [Mesorhizobium loti]
MPSYEATLVAPDPFEAYLNGDDTAIDPSETRSGPFMEKGCSSCHSGVNIGGEGYIHSAS